MEILLFLLELINKKGSDVKDDIPSIITIITANIIMTG
jgi:uncharacterized UBP type Zn finger protein